MTRVPGRLASGNLLQLVPLLGHFEEFFASSFASCQLRPRTTLLRMSAAFLGSVAAAMALSIHLPDSRAVDLDQE